MNSGFLSLAAIVLYGAVALAAMAACGTAAKSGQPSWNRRTWLALALLFVVLIVLRGFNVEETIRAALRESLRAEGAYAERREVQGLVASTVLFVSAAVASWWLFRRTRMLRGRRNFATMAALVAGMAMVFLVLLRLISLHMIDVALYGPFKLNWIADIGSSLVVLTSAVIYIRLVRAPLSRALSARRQ